MIRPSSFQLLAIWEGRVSTLSDFGASPMTRLGLSVDHCGRAKHSGVDHADLCPAIIGVCSAITGLIVRGQIYAKVAMCFPDLPSSCLLYTCRRSAARHLDDSRFCMLSNPNHKGPSGIKTTDHRSSAWGWMISKAS